MQQTMDDNSDDDDEGKLSRGGKEEENMTIEGRRSREGPKDVMQQPTNGGAQLEAEALTERRRWANGRGPKMPCNNQQTEGRN